MSPSSPWTPLTSVSQLRHLPAPWRLLRDLFQLYMLNSGKVDFWGPEASCIYPIIEQPLMDLLQHASLVFAAGNKWAGRKAVSLVPATPHSSQGDQTKHRQSPAQRGAGNRSRAGGHCSAKELLEELTPEDKTRRGLCSEHRITPLKPKERKRPRAH